MYKFHTQVKALLILIIFVLGVTTFERAEVIAQHLEYERQTANIFDAFFGNSNGSDAESTTQNTPENYEYPSIQLSTPTPTSSSSSGNSGTNNKAIHGVTPTLVCIPGTVGEEEEVIIMWACRDSAHSATGEGFETDGETIGAIRVTPTESATYAVRCENDISGIDDTITECSVRLADPTITFAATPTSVESGEQVRLSWRTSEVRDCEVKSNRHSSFVRSGIQGDVVTPALTNDTIFALQCETDSGTVETKTITVDIQ